MSTPDTPFEKYELVVGLEIHAQLSTNSKIFSSDSAAFGAGPNEHTSPVSLGLPGTLPRINRQVVASAVKMGLATNCRINLANRFDRKNYFYADLPKGYQVTQDALPVCQQGYVHLKLKGQAQRTVRINRIHMEEDAGKSMHDKDNRYSLIDLNRAGVPLVEIVSEPDIRSAEEAAAYLSEIRKIARYLGVCDGNMEEGSLRCDANISVRLRGAETYGNRCEVKNLNSIRNLQRAINYEFKRQVALLEKGETIGQNTLNFDAGTGETSVLRSKEMAYDYRYFPEPDLQPLELSQEWVEEIHHSLPELPEDRANRYTRQFSLSGYDASLLTAERAVADFFEELVKFTGNYKSAANWINGPIQSYLNENNLEIAELPLPANIFGDIIELVDSGKINHTAAVKQLFPAMLADPRKNIIELVAGLDLLIDTCTDDLDHYIATVLARYPDKVSEYHKGKKGVLGLFMGDVMRLSGGKIDPGKTNKLIIQKLEALK
ncbi:Asp-tRNA(Asn)/Glu-tRNA(Gln) amidotransferase subunit GatB [Hufsiella ginkgonis]|uniref:Aspartyl/glutamyl-tRNA(Asn/Gln) amidotransferase subunit B n=1 Tax=Hufsiella ginkgonis TaxID=2695274 RepID=A0A7K1XVV2_9SPHI|nr:Asp-tRNA(Asn)/Glu-tRNA(Gln) amidotransferase subunit GatB [Hufsiella ginkgonis]MXV15112.1 Asp-tRNA(Asn)/Glu-tRNA(Gln) amidotransferase subunit GatB [Hufsiella ginkgonis]